MIQSFRKAFAVIVTVLLAINVQSQVEIGDDEILNLDSPREYEIGGVSVTGVKNFDTQAILLYAGLDEGEKVVIPGEKISKAIQNLWDQNLFEDIVISVTEIEGNLVYLNIHLTERPRLSRFRFEGVSKGDADKLREKIQLVRGNVVNENLIASTRQKVRQHFVDKGRLKTEVRITQQADSLVKGGVILTIAVDKSDKVKIQEITFVGNEAYNDNRLERVFKKTKERGIFRIFSPSKFVEDLYEKDKQKLIDFYNKNGYRNFSIKSDSIWAHDEDEINIQITVKEGQQFYFGDVKWVGNTKYSSERLSRVLGIEPGEIYNREKFESRLFMNPNGGDVSSLYLDDGYLAFQAVPVETGIEGDTINTEIRIYEGRQYRVDEITIKGNTKTNERVIRREIRTKPGELFSRSDIIRTQRELGQLGYFDPQGFEVNPIQNDQEGTVDIEYTVAERPSDQIELSGGWGAGRIVGTLGISFTNFSLRNIDNPEAWRPLPAGDGQSLSFRIQTNGVFFQSYNLSFTEPWLGGKKPNSLSFSLQHSRQNLDGELSGGRSLSITGGTVGLGQRLEWPDDYFQLYTGINYLYYDLNEYNAGGFIFSDGYSHNLAATVRFSRNSIFDPIYPRYGSNIKTSIRFTPPYSLFENVDDYSTLSSQERYRFVEYYKWKVTAEWYIELAPKLVTLVRSGFGYLGAYNQDKGISPFERFYLGGSALSGFQLDGREIIALRGYDNNSLGPNEGANFITKSTVELRYPISLNPSATIFGLTFMEAGNAFGNQYESHPFELYRSAGIGLRIFLPMFGMMGLDYGWRLDDVPGQPGMPSSQFHFTIGTNFGEL